MRFAQAINVLDGVGRQAAPVIVDEHPLGHVGVPMATGAVEVLIDLGDKIGSLHRIWGVALEHRLRADAPAVAFQVAIGTIRAHFLEIGAEGMASQANKPILERSTLQAQERHPEAINIDGSLQLIHGEPRFPLARGRCLPTDRRSLAMSVERAP